MSQSLEQTLWVQAGRLAGVSTETAWLVLLVALGVAAVMVLLSYWRTLAPLTLLRRAVLCGLRISMLAGLLLIIAAPTKVVRVHERPARTKRPLAVLVDRSDSMTAPDNREQRRLDDALHQWRKLEPAATQAFSTVSTFAFAGELAPVPSVSAAGPFATGETRLLRALRDVLARAPEGGWGSIVVLTDGVDTAEADVEPARREILRTALSGGTPLHFVVGRNRVLDAEFLKLREFNVPPRAAPNSVVALNAIFESSRTRAVTLPVELRRNDNSAPSGSLRLEPGRHVETWTADGRVAEPGLLRFELRVGNTVARSEVRVEAPPPNRVLLLQGQLDWTQRFLGRALSRDGTFQFVPIWPFDPSLAVPAGSATGFPADQDLASLGIIILDNVATAQLPASRHSALTQWVKEGGILVVIVSDPQAAGRFAGSELEKALPVVFLPGGAPPAELRAPAMSPGEIPVPPHPVLPAAVPFVWENPARLREVFGDEVPIPAFYSWAPTARLKPGADLLARHPVERAPDGTSAVVLALQRYGQGKSVVLATDPLWRWQLGQADDAHRAERFWTTLLAWLYRDRDPGFHFDRPPVTSPVEQAASVRVVGAKGRKLSVVATLGSRKVTLREGAEADDARVFEWTPPTPGFWEIEARDDEAHQSRMWVTVEPPAPKRGELPASAPNETLLRTLAMESSGSLLTEPPPSWRQTHLPAQLVRETRTALWHEPWLLAGLVALYGVELLLRRRWQLL